MVDDFLVRYGYPYGWFSKARLQYPESRAPLVNVECTRLSHVALRGLLPTKLRVSTHRSVSLAQTIDRHPRISIADHRCARAETLQCISARYD